MKIRRLAKADFLDWSALWADYLAFYGTSRAVTYHRSYFQRLLGQSANDLQAFVAEIDSHLVGLTHYTYHAHGWQEEPVCYLQDLFTASAVRGNGVGATLIDTVRKQAAADGAKGLYWLTQSNNHAARKLYDRVGALTDFIKYDGGAA